MYDLDRFVKAQEHNYKYALQEIQAGHKQSCWMWYVFPQIRGLGRSYMAKNYEIENIEEAKAYLAHPILGNRLQEITQAALETKSDNAGEVFGYPDNLKFCSSMTLFERADPQNPIYGKALDKFFHGRRDEATLKILKKQMPHRVRNVEPAQDFFSTQDDLKDMAAERDRLTGKDHVITDCFFDLYGTLVDIHTDEEKSEVWNTVRSEILSWGEGCRLSSEELKDCFFEGQVRLQHLHPDDKERWEFPEMDMHLIFSYMLSRCGVLPVEERIVRITRIFRLASIEHCRLYDGAMDFLVKLKQSGRRIWLVTNAQRLFTFPEIEQLGLDKVFHGIYISSDIGYRKPDSRIFRAPLNEQHLNPEHVVMIGNDGTSDIAGAKACGLKTIYFHTNCSPWNDKAEADLCLEGADYEHAFQWIASV